MNDGAEMEHLETSYQAFFDAMEVLATDEVQGEGA
jgi:hypothetical protein